MALRKRRSKIGAFISPPLGYCPLVWRLHSQELNNKINSDHERALRIPYGDKISSFQNLLKMVTLFQYMKETYNHWQLKCLRSTMI